MPFALLLLLFLCGFAPAAHAEGDELLAPTPEVKAGTPAAPIAPVVIEGEAPQLSTPVQDDTPPRAAPVEAEAIPAPPVKPAVSPASSGPSPAGDFPPDLWNEGTYLSLTPLLQQAAVALLEGALGEPVLKTLAAKLARASAEAPLGSAVDGMRFYEARMLLAAAAGDNAAAKLMEKAHPDFLSSPGKQRLAAIALMAGDLDSPCGMPEVASPHGSFWQKLGLICTLRSGNGQARAQLALDLMREAGETDKAFLDLAESAASNQKTTNAKPAALPALHVALMVAGGVKPNAAMLELLAHNPYPLFLQLQAPAEWKARIALALAARGLLSGADLGEAFSRLALKDQTVTRLRVKPETLNDAKTIPESLSAPYALRAARMESSPRAKAKILNALIALSAPQELAGGLGALILEVAPPSSSFDDAATAAPLAHLALLRGDASAMSWVAAARHPPELAALEAAQSLSDNTPAALAAYAKSGAARERKADALALLQALGVDPGAEALMAVKQDGASLPVAAKDAALDIALEHNRKGEALLRVLLLSQGDAISVLLLRVQTLRALGFEKEAKALALPRL